MQYKRCDKNNSKMFIRVLNTSLLWWVVVLEPQDDAEMEVEVVDHPLHLVIQLLTPTQFPRKIGPCAMKR